MKITINREDVDSEKDLHDLKHYALRSHLSLSYTKENLTIYYNSNQSLIGLIAFIKAANKKIK